MRSQKNELFSIIRNGNRNTHDFEWLTIGSPNKNTWDIEVLRHNPSGSYFAFDWINNSYDGEKRLATYSPGEDETTVRRKAYDWQDMIMAFLTWLDNIDREYGQEDLWTQLENEDTLNTWLSSNDPFNEEELVEVRKALSNVRGLLLDAVGSNDAIRQDVNKRIDELESRLNTIGRKDFILLLNEVILSKLFEWGLTTEHLHNIVNIIIHAGTKLLGS